MTCTYMRQSVTDGQVSVDVLSVSGKIMTLPSPAAALCATTLSETTRPFMDDQLAVSRHVWVQDCA